MLKKILVKLIYSQISNNLIILYQKVALTEFEKKRKTCVGKICKIPHCTEFCAHLHSAVWKLREFSLTHFWQKFRESSGFIK